MGVEDGDRGSRSFLDRVVELDFEYEQHAHKKRDPRVLACAVY